MDDNVMDFPVADMETTDADDALSDFANEVAELAVDAFQVGNDVSLSMVGSVDGNMVRVTVSIDYA